MSKKDKTYTCQTCHHKAVTYDEELFVWICGNCGDIDHQRTKKDEDDTRDRN